MAESLTVEVVFALPGRQKLVEVSLSQGATVGDAVAASGLSTRFPDNDLSACETGIWGRVVSLDKPLADGDRVEIYRPLEMDPREARRQLAEAGLTMGRSTDA